MSGREREDAGRLSGTQGGRMPGVPLRSAGSSQGHDSLKVRNRRKQGKHAKYAGGYPALYLKSAGRSYNIAFAQRLARRRIQVFETTQSTYVYLK